MKGKDMKLIHLGIGIEKGKYNDVFDVLDHNLSVVDNIHYLSYGVTQSEIKIYLVIEKMDDEDFILENICDYLKDGFDRSKITYITIDSSYNKPDEIKIDKKKPKEKNSGYIWRSSNGTYYNAESNSWAIFPSNVTIFESQEIACRIIQNNENIHLHKKEDKNYVCDEEIELWSCDQDKDTKKISNYRLINVYRKEKKK